MTVETMYIKVKGAAKPGAVGPSLTRTCGPTFQGSEAKTVRTAAKFEVKREAVEPTGRIAGHLEREADRKDEG